MQYSLTICMAFMLPCNLDSCSCDRYYGCRYTYVEKQGMLMVLTHKSCSKFLFKPQQHRARVVKKVWYNYSE